MTTTAVLIHEKLDQIQEVELDLAPHVNEAHILLGRHPTFIGQWPEIDVVIMKSEIGKVPNENDLPEPFSNVDVLGPILLIKMDEQSQPQNFTLEEYKRFISKE
tara:strand:+ start:558 stop:869 length:312 start_codon:yes stop_codon:yes gene_type:complete